MRKRSYFKFLILTFSTLSFLFVILPILHLLFSLNTESFLKTLKDREVWNALFTTFEGATLSTILGVTLGVPVAYVLSQSYFKGRKFLEGLFDLPIVIPHAAVGIIFLELLNSKSLLGELLSKLGITFVDTIYGIVVVMCFVSISYIVASSLAGFESVNRELIWTARTLGASPFKVFRLIIFPLSIPFILRGAVLAFARAVSEMGALLIVAYYPKTIPILMYERFENYGLSSSTPIAALVTFLSLVIFSIVLSLPYRRYSRVS
ncbi:molybdate/tungstate transport system permease protein [Balnearium lithotrophicum]|uniref:Molybdate/tungstate transport system permease protein n=1 Tax=Balnearium lithotrophicum TaxID=223788 RepID=A0A521BH04_9BACT|nr:ABC transporter permease [Balnearium lithotrophicum]SMO46211.1 molybdate/tungstate transport system permease protein [Balnearium lithotrophicum]